MRDSETIPELGFSPELVGVGPFNNLQCLGDLLGRFTLIVVFLPQILDVDCEFTSIDLVLVRLTLNMLNNMTNTSR